MCDLYSAPRAVLQRRPENRRGRRSHGLLVVMAHVLHRTESAAIPRRLFFQGKEAEVQ
jgi:hypothetical protein